MEPLKFGPITVKNQILLKAFNYFDSRYGIKEILDDEVFEKIAPTHLGFWSCFGGLTFFLFISQIVTGALLMVYYEPTIARAHASVTEITNEIPFGWMFRGMHAWGANLMIITIFIHMAKIFISGVYKAPRELNWVVGVSLFTLTLGLAFTGYLLPWTQLAYWATVVGTEVPSALPYGEWISYAMRGGVSIDQTTLTRFYAIHVMILPITTVAMIGAHLVQIRRQGIAGPL